MRGTKNKLLLGILLMGLLVGAFLWGGPIKKADWPVGETRVTEQEKTALPSTPSNDAKEEQGVLSKQEEKTSDNVKADKGTLKQEENSIKESKEQQEENNKKDKTQQIEVEKAQVGESISNTQPKEKKEKDTYQTEPVPEGKPLPVEPQGVEVSKKQGQCTLSVRCDTLVANLNQLESNKQSLVPKDGIIYEEQTVTFYEGESVFDVLLREMQKNKIHMEFENTPIYNSAYIEGIQNLYEFDGGELSGWMYKVNDWFPNYGCSRYLVQEGDRIEWVYTCDLGRDVGGEGAFNEEGEAQ